MAVKNITLMGHPTLMTPAEAVADPTAPAIRALIEDMQDSMTAAGGIGIAAPQIGVGLRVVMFRTPPNQEDADQKDADQGAGDSTDESLRAGLDQRPLTILINPRIETLSDNQATGWEGCLSVPGLKGLVPRHTHIRYSGLAPDGSVIDREAHGFHAVVVQHECDHLDGILYPMRMTDLSSLQYVGAAEGGSYAPAPHSEAAQ